MQTKDFLCLLMHLSSVTDVVIAAASLDLPVKREKCCSLPLSCYFSLHCFTMKYKIVKDVSHFSPTSSSDCPKKAQQQQ